MKKFLFTILLSLVFVIGIGGCAVSHVPVVTMNVLDPTLASAQVPWRTEIARRFPDADVVFVHGGDFVRGEWIMATDPSYEHVESVESVIARYKRPDHVLILLSCNPGHVILHNHPGVFYALDSVWVWPDRSLTPSMFQSREAYQRLDSEDDDPTMQQPQLSRWETHPEVFGNIFEFIEAR